MHSLVWIFSVQFLAQLCVNAQQGTYRAAVVEYAPNLQSSDPQKRLLENVNEYIEFIDRAASQDAQIIVFPEDGLSGWEDINNATVDSYSTEVPDPTEQISPCALKNSNYPKFFCDLSCAAQSHSIYTVVNLIEKRHDNATNRKIYHNTNVVFDKNGVVIARYRKMNLFNEPVFVAGTNTASFKTDFGVTFGMFICFDIMFKNSALDVLSDPAVTDIVYSAAWFSHLPFYGALSIQHGYARSNGVNLLASGLNDPDKKNGGSGIYLADGTIVKAYIKPARLSYLIVEDVPRISEQKPTGSCQSSLGVEPRFLGGGQMPDISDFRTSHEDLSNYTVKTLNLKDNKIKETVCSGKFCCSFDIVLTINPNVQPNYVYKLIAYNGISQISLTRSLGLRNCIIVACSNNNTSSCGDRKKQAPTGVTFESINVKGSFNLNTTFLQPATLKYDLMPVTDYTYCKKDNGSNGVNVEIEMATAQPQNSLLTFGLYGRVFTNDDKPAGPINSATPLLTNVYVAFIISSFIFLLQD